MDFRLDVLLVEKGLVKSRERAKELIKNNGVTVDGKVVNKPSVVVSSDSTVEIIVEQLKYVSRGGLKLETALRTFDVDVKNCVCVDMGASTGGFTDCLLQNGAKKVYAVDVGHDQLDKSLCKRDDVVNIEGVNVKEFSPEYIGEKVDVVTADLSFISIRKALPVIKSLLKNNAFGIVLIKPQFEVGRNNIGKGGIVKDKSAHIDMLTDIIPFVEKENMRILNIICSGIKGGDGNIEYLALIKNESPTKSFLANFDVKKLVNDSFDSMK
ncbi:MAG: TlyA family RNA methyltransferase [Ruminococcus sp.]|nr:TlyA family RNA methyltransferase [Ruminococcus sp.]